MTIEEPWNPLGTLVSMGFLALARIVLKAVRRGIPRVRTNKESEKEMATVKTKKAKTEKNHASGSETPMDDCKGQHPKKSRKINLKDLVDDNDDGGDKLVGGVAGALLGGVAGALLGGILGVVAESFKSAASDDDYEVDVDEDGNIAVGSVDDDDDDEAECEDEEEEDDEAAEEEEEE